MRICFVTPRILLLLLFAAAHRCNAATATNPSGTISTLGDDGFTLNTPSEQLPEYLSVRVVDAYGRPVPGLTVSFFNDENLCEPLQPCSAPESIVYGHFADGSGEVDVLTDANGIATATQPYIGGYEPGAYRISALIGYSASTKNSAFVGNNGDLFLDFAVNQVFAESPILNGYMSGNWYNPGLSGQGFQLEFTSQNNTVVMYWFTFAPDGSGQVWIAGQGTYNTNVHSVDLEADLYTGARFPPAFRTSDVQQVYWGRLTISLTDCNNGFVSWNSLLPLYANGSMPITRITSIDGAACPQ